MLMLARTHAQNSVFSLKPVAGLTTSQVHGDPYVGFDKPGGMGGLFVNAAFAKHASLELGFIFNEKGAKHSQNPDKGDYSYYKLDLDYLEVPLILRIQPTFKKLGEKWSDRFFLTLGVSGGYLFHSYEANELGQLNIPFKSYEYSCNAGIGLQLSSKIAFEVRSNNSFATIRPFGAGISSNIYSNNFIARKFNKGYYNNILEFFFSYKISPKRGK